MTDAGIDAARARILALLAQDDDSVAAALSDLCTAESERRLALCDDEVARAAVAALDHPHRTRQRRVAEALVALLSDCPTLAPRLRSALRAPSARLRWGAAFVLGRAGSPPPEAWPAAREALALTDGDQRWAAAELAVAVVRAHPELRGALRDGLLDPSATLRKMTLYCLRDLGDADLPRLARSALPDADPGVRLAALAALARTPPGGETALAIAARLAEDPDPGVRRAAAAALGRLGFVDAVVREALEAALRSSDPSLARAARAALAALPEE